MNTIMKTEYKRNGGNNIWHCLSIMLRKTISVGAKVKLLA